MKFTFNVMLTYYTLILKYNFLDKLFTQKTKN